MRSIGEALRAMMPAFRPVGTERVMLVDALGRFAARSPVARFDLPPFDNSAMDGYAVRAEDLAGASADAPRALPVVGESRAGGPTPGALEGGTAMRIFTGAKMPAGADAIVIQEDTAPQDDGRVAFRVAPRVGHHIRGKATDLAEGAPLVPLGRPIGPGEIGLVASQGIGALEVWRRPTVAIVSTGDELRDVTDPPRPGSIVNSNAYALAAQVAEAGGMPWVLPNVPDDMDAIVETLRQAARADLVLTCGGVSVGAYDLTREAFERAGIEADFWKVRIKPGKPLTFGRAGDVPVVGLPGNPVSAMVTFEAMVRPGLRAMLGDPMPHRPLKEVVTTAPHRHGTGRPELARIRVEPRDGALLATFHALQGSGSLPSMVDIDGFALLPADQATFDAGTRLPALLLRDGGRSADIPFD